MGNPEQFMGRNVVLAGTRRAQADTVRAYGEPLGPDYPRYTSGSAMLETAERFTPEEKELRIEAEGLLAVALQHEIDHLDGKLFIDRISRLKRDLYKRKLKKMLREGRFEEAASKNPAVHI